MSFRSSRARKLMCLVVHTFCVAPEAFIDFPQVLRFISYLHHLDILHWSHNHVIIGLGQVIEHF